MKKPLLIVVGVVIVAAVISGNLWRSLRNERVLNEELRSQLAEARNAARVPAAAAAALAPMPSTAPSPTATARSAPAQVTGQTPMELSSMNVQIRASTAGLLDSALLISSAGTNEGDLLKDPEYRKAEILQLRMRLAQSNPGLAEAMGISEREAARLFEAMADDQLKRTADLAARRAAGESTASVTASILQRSPAEDPVRVTLGEEKYAKYQDYQRNVRPALTQVASIGSMLTTVGQPLNDSQARSLATAMLAEQQRQRQAPFTPRAPAPRGIVDMLEDSAKRQDDANRQILEAAGTVLSAAQLDALRKKYDHEAAERRQSLETTRQREATRPSPVGAAF